MSRCVARFCDVCRENLNCDLLCRYAVSSGNTLRTFRDNLSVPFFKGGSLKMGPIGRSEISVRNYRHLLCNNTEERSS